MTAEVEPGVQEVQEPGVQEVSYRYQVQEDVIVRQCAPKDFILNAIAYKPQENDTFLIGYPRSGVTWLAYILFLLKNQGKRIDFTERLWEDIPEVGVGRHVRSSFGSYFVQLAEMVASPRILRTHLPSDMAPVHQKAKCIYISRNPLDTAVSMYHDIMSVNEFDGRFDDFFDYFIHGQGDYNCYFNHHLGWVQRTKTHEILWITYEELTRHPRDVIIRIGEFMGGEFTESANNEEVMSEILKACAFIAMKGSENMLTQKTRNGHSLFRRGVIGDFKNFFTEAQVTQVRELTQRYFKGTQLENSWEEYKLPL